MKSPFKFLDSYTKDDREIFFGRDREIEELYHRVFESKIMLVYGVSGTGKSSLIHCGLANKFQDTDWLPIVIRRGGNMVESMAAAISAASITKQSGLVNPSNFKKGVRSLYLDHYKPVFFIFDQFEELFIFGNKEERRSFIHIVKELAESDLQCRMIFVMREEYMAGVTEFEKYIPTFFSNRVRIEKMSHRNALEAIKGPCNAFKISLEEGFADTLLEKLSPGSEDVELTYLQVFLDKIYRLAPGFLPPPGGESKGGAFTLSLLEKTGNVSDLLGSFLDEQIALLVNPEEGLAVLKSFVSVKGTKRQMSLDKVSEYAHTLGKPIKDSSLNELLQTFISLRILRDKDQQEKYELRHDALATKIYDKITLVEKEVLEVRNFIENEYENYKKRNRLLDGKDLEYISRYEKNLYLKGDLNDFVKKSRDLQGARQRTFRIITSIAAVVFLIILCGAGYYFFRSSFDVQAKNQALLSIFIKGDYPSAAWRIASQAYKLKKIPITTRAVFESFYNLLDQEIHYDSLGIPIYPQKEIFDFTACKADILHAGFSADGTYIWGFLADSTIKTWDRNGQEVLSFEAKAPVLTVKLSHDNKLIGGLDSDSTVYIWNQQGDKILTSKAFYNKINPNNILDFSPDGRYLAYITSDRKVILCNTSGEAFQTLDGHTDEVVSVNFSNDSKFIATTSMDSTIIVWYYNKVRSVFDIYVKLKGHKDIVWSAYFSGDSKYVLSSSADSTYKIWNLNGKIVYNASFGLFDRQLGAKLCDARFTANYNAIISVRYEIADTGKRSDRLIMSETQNIYYNKRCTLFDMEANYPGAYELYWKYFNRLILSDSIGKIFFTSIDVTINPEYTAYSLSNNNVTFFCGTKDALRLFKFKGTLQQFSPDGKYLLTADKQYLRLYPSDEIEMFRLIEEQKILWLEPKQSIYSNWYAPE
jgi:WD40 repeat protein